MTVLSAQTIRRLGIVSPFVIGGRHEPSNTSVGLSACGYDLQLAEDVQINRGEFILASAVEYFNMPKNVVGIVHDKSTWARRGLAVQNTVIEPGWRGFLTLELTMHGRHGAKISRGAGIAQVVFHFLDEPTEMPYEGKYQDQQAGPQGAR